MRPTLAHLIVRFDGYDNDMIEDNLNGCTGSLGSLSNFTALVTLEVSIALLFGQTRLSTSQKPSLAEILPPRLRQLTINDDRWDHSVLLHTEGPLTMAVFKDFFAGERLTDDWTEDTELEDTKWVKFGDPPWRTATPEFQEFVLDTRIQGRASYGYWYEKGPKEDLQSMCAGEGIKCSVLRAYEDEPDL